MPTPPPLTCPSCGTEVVDVVVSRLVGTFTVPCNHRVVAWRNDIGEIRLEFVDG